MKQLLNSIAHKHNFEIVNYSRVHGGDINECYVVNTGNNNLFIKVNAATKYPGMFASEAVGLETLTGKSQIIVPRVLHVGIENNSQFLIMEFLEKVPPETPFWPNFATELAALHRNTNNFFGATENNYFGSLVQSNKPSTNWDYFFANERILPLVKQLFDRGLFNSAQIKNAEAICNKLTEIFPVEPPALLHGDLWSGNFLCIRSPVDPSQTIAAIFDPAVYFGYREMDIGMTLLFGGFDGIFHDVYNESFPLSPGWENRVSLTQLYPLLAHALLFGGNYVSTCKRILQQWA